ncbi:MAG: sodium/proton-translocating pyrophosphatase, partial [Nanoarchaeota archaeon]
MQFVLFIVAVGLLSVFVAKYIASQIKKAEDGSEKMREIGDAIHEGAMAFLMREYKAIAVFVVVMAAIIFLFLDHPKTEAINEAPWTAFAFVLGSSISILAGFIGMKIATKANVKTANAAQKSLSKAFDIAFKSGSVLGFALVGLAVLGISLSYILFKSLGFPVETIMEVLTGFALGGSSIAL